MAVAKQSSLCLTALYRDLTCSDAFWHVISYNDMCTYMLLFTFMLYWNDNRFMAQDFLLTECSTSGAALSDGSQASCNLHHLASGIILEPFNVSRGLTLRVVHLISFSYMSCRCYTCSGPLPLSWQLHVEVVWLLSPVRASLTSLDIGTRLISGREKLLPAMERYIETLRHTKCWSSMVLLHTNPFSTGHNLEANLWSNPEHQWWV